MLLIENIRLALNGLKANKMRALLTMLGIIIGISSVIAIMTVGNSLTVFMNEAYADMGINNIDVMVERRMTEEEMNGQGYYSSGIYKEPTDSDYLSAQIISEYLDKFEGRADYIILQEYVSANSITEGDRYAYINAYGVNYGKLKMDNINLLKGRFFTENEMSGGKMVCIISDYTVDNMYDGDMEQAVGSVLTVPVGDKNYDFTIVGIYEYKQSQFDFNNTSKKDTSTNFYMPVTSAKRINHSENYQYFNVVPVPGTDVNTLVDDTMNFFNTKYYTESSPFDVWAYSMSSYMEEMNTMMNTSTIAISVIAGIALLVGGIGVMNIMLVSITERTREIGTRKALGAPNSSIRIQFIVESIVICIIGGTIGMVLGFGLGALGCKLTQTPVSFSLSSVVISVGFSLAIGVFFGYYPANKAAKLDPIEALRYE